MLQIPRVLPRVPCLGSAKAAQCPRPGPKMSPGSTPGMAAHKCIISHNSRGHNYLHPLQNHSAFFSCTLHLKPTNLEIRCLIQATESLILQIWRSAYFARCKKQVGMFLLSYRSKNVFVFGSLYDPFYCNMICFTAVF